MRGGEVMADVDRHSKYFNQENLIVTGSQMVSFSGLEGVMWLDPSSIGSFPVSFIMVIIIYIIMHVLLTRTAQGHSIYCAGGNMEATRLFGINSANVLTFCYVISGLMAALAGLVSIGRSGICNGVNAIQPYDRRYRICHHRRRTAQRHL